MAAFKAIVQPKKGRRKRRNLSMPETMLQGPAQQKNAEAIKKISEMCSKVDYTARLVNKRLSAASQNNTRHQSGQQSIINNNFVNITNNFFI